MTRSESGPPGPRAGASPGSIAGDLEPCWSCGAPVAPRALFCHACGAIQPPRDLDPFARLGMERRFALDPAQLTRQHAGFGRALDPQRFAAKGLREQANAKAQADALQEAFETLRDPVRRAHALLNLLGGDRSTTVPVLGENESDDDLAALTDALSAAAADGAALDRLGLDIAGRIEDGIGQLGPALAKAQGDPTKIGAATHILARLEGLEALAAEAAARRAILSAPRT